MPFQIGNSEAKKGRHAAGRAWKRALHVALLRRQPDGRRALQHAADALITAALKGDVSALKEIGDRLDGKPTRVIAGDRDEPPVRVEVQWAE